VVFIDALTVKIRDGVVANRSVDPCVAGPCPSTNRAAPRSSAILENASRDRRRPYKRWATSGGARPDGESTASDLPNGPAQQL
jgi:hypothetical protein